MRFLGRQIERRDIERRAFERDLFPRDIPTFGNLSELSQRSVESLSQYDQFENVYAPSTTPCYDTPSHNNDSQPAFEPEKMCYTDVGTKPNDQEGKDACKRKTSESTTKIEEVEGVKRSCHYFQSTAQETPVDNEEKGGESEMNTSKHQLTTDNT